MADDAWMENCLIAISAVGGSDVAFQALTESVDPDLPEKDIEGIALVNGGRITKFMAEGDATITFEAYPMEAGTDSGTTGKGFFDLLHAQDASQPLRITNGSPRTKYRVALMWTDDTSVVTADGAVSTTAKTAKRIVVANGFFTKVKDEFTDRILKTTVTFKAVPYDKSGNSNIMQESVDDSDILPALASYTTSVNW